MKEMLQKYYNEYTLINGIIEIALQEKAQIQKNLAKTTAGSLYLSLNEEQKSKFRDIYSDRDILKDYFCTESLNKFFTKRNNLIKTISESSCFPFPLSESSTIYIKDGIDTYDALNDISTKNLELSDELKIFIGEIVNYLHPIDESLTIEDIPLIKTFYNELVKSYDKDSPFFKEALTRKLKKNN